MRSLSPDIQSIGRLAKTKRDMLGLTQKDVAGLCNVGIRFLSDLENGKPTLEIAKVFHVMRALGLEIHITPRGPR